MRLTHFQKFCNVTDRYRGTLTFSRERKRPSIEDGIEFTTI